MLLDKFECFECKVNDLFSSVLQSKICFDPPTAIPRPVLVSSPYSYKDKGLHECTACIRLVARLFFIRHTHTPVARLYLNQHRTYVPAVET